MPFGATPSRWCVCQFHHFRLSTVILLVLWKSFYAAGLGRDEALFLDTVVPSAENVRAEI